MDYHKHFIPLESDPLIFTQLAHKLGVRDGLEFIDILSLEDTTTPNQGSIAALILNLPPCSAYEREKGNEPLHTGHGNEEPIWVKQTIHNACGLYALIHAVCNVPGAIQPGSFLNQLMQAHNRTEFLNTSVTLEELYREAAVNGSSEAPPAGVEVDHHYICIIRQSGQLFILDGEMSGPILRDKPSVNTDTWPKQGLGVVREYTESEKNGSFNLLALVNTQDA
ncbi:hypothetical protein BDV25DRAFT_149824 [Aspergillus avenaceus]|uniref:Ubiquitin carboxyl-terminal hydrolase n=1 Tax=Aspergillus avenaceus TaxID=36643 RepID=A0A5N6U3G8_ASPAV|nr:hypothetical protein BDV25DRAFT_149824 [Aspergillus avenaceus]